MRNAAARFKVVLATLVLMMVAGGCQTLPANSGALESLPTRTVTQAASFQQLIIKFKPNTIACDADGIAQLSVATKVQIELVRPMSGPACVIKQWTDKDGGFARGQQALRQHPAVEWLELDAIMKAL